MNYQQSETVERLLAELIRLLKLKDAREIEFYRKEIILLMEEQLGTEYRAPTCGLSELTIIDLLATGSKGATPGYLSVSPEKYFADEFNRNFHSDAKPFLATVLDKSNARQQEGKELRRSHASGQEPSLLGVSNQIDLLATGLDATIFYLDARKALEMGRGASPALGFASTALLALSAYETSNTPAQFAIAMGTNAVAGYAGSIVTATATSALQGSVVGPYGAIALGTIAGTTTALGISYSGDIAASLVSYATGSLTEGYMYLDREITYVLFRGSL